MTMDTDTLRPRGSATMTDIESGRTTIPLADTLQMEEESTIGELWIHNTGVQGDMDLEGGRWLDT